MMWRRLRCGGIEWNAVLIDDPPCRKAVQMYDPSMTLVACKLPKKLDRVAMDEGRSTQGLLRTAIGQRLKTKRAIGRTFAYDLVKHLVGMLEGPSDLATNP